MTAKSALQPAHKISIEGIIGLCANRTFKRCALFAPVPQIGDPWRGWRDAMLRKICMLNVRPPLRLRLVWLFLSKYSHRVLRCLLPLNPSNFHAIPPTGLIIAVRRGMGGHCQAVIAVVVVVAVRGGRQEEGREDGGERA
jgi:hypothetical protein